MTEDIDEFVLNNGVRYNVAISDYFREDTFIIYEATITDTAFLKTQKLYFRFKTLKKMH